MVNKLRFLISIWLGKLLGWATQLRGNGGTALPGLVVEKFFPGFLTEARGHCAQVVVISGTNGKTSTQTLLSHVLREAYGSQVIVNSRGANLSRGLVAEFCRQFDWLGRRRWQIAVFEVEEATLPRIAGQLTPDIFIYTNLFRDQLDAYGEIERTRTHLSRALGEVATAKLIINVDDPQLRLLASELPTKRYELHGVAVQLPKGEEIAYETVTAPSVAELNWQDQLQLELDELHTDFSTTVRVVGAPWDASDYRLQLPGLHSLYSLGFVLQTLTVLADMRALSSSIAKVPAAVASCAPAFGRGESLALANGKQVRVLLVKNPVGFALTLSLLRQLPTLPTIALLVNDAIADGRDVSWLWDSPLEVLTGLPQRGPIICAGSRAADMALRLKYAGLPANMIQQTEITDLPGILADEGSDAIVIATYTAMNQFRQALLATHK